MGIIKYALYEEEPKDPMVQLFVEGLKGQIDGSQNRRARGFSNENIEQTKLIIKYHEEHPDASQNEISKALGISKGKVNKVIQEYNSDVGHRSRSIQSISESLSETISEDDTDHNDGIIFNINQHPKMAAKIMNN